MYQGGGVEWRVDRRLRLDRGDGKYEDVVWITDNNGGEKVVTVDNFHRNFIPTEIQVGETVYEYSMGHILRTFVAKDVKNGEVSYRTIDGLKTALTTEAKVYGDCRMKVITPTANTPHSKYIYGTFYIEHQLQNLSLLRKIGSDLNELGGKIDRIGANTQNIRSEDLQYLLGAVEDMTKMFNKIINYASR